MKLSEVPRNTNRVRVLQDVMGLYGTPDVKAGDVVEFVYHNAYDSTIWYGRRVSDQAGVTIPLNLDVEILT